MTDTASNDNNATPTAMPLREPDAHGQAALLLVESLIHGLIAQSVIGVEDAVDIVSTAIEVKTDTGYELGDTPLAIQKSLALLGAINASLRLDLPKSSD